MVFIALEHIVGTEQAVVEPFFLIFGDIPRRFAFTEFLPAAVAFEIRFVDQIDAVLVAKLIPAALIRVMRRANGIDVMLFQKHDVPEHVFFGHAPTVSAVEFVAVDAFEDDAFAI